MHRIIISMHTPHIKEFLLKHQFDFQMLSRDEKTQHRNSLFPYIKHQTNIDIRYALTSAEGILVLTFNSAEERTLFLLEQGSV